MRCQLHPFTPDNFADPTSLRIPARSFPTLKNLATLRQPIPLSFHGFPLFHQRARTKFNQCANAQVSYDCAEFASLFFLLSPSSPFALFLIIGPPRFRGEDQRLEGVLRRREDLRKGWIVRRNMRFVFGEFLNGRGSLSYSASSRIPFIRTYFVNEVDTVMKIVQQVDVLWHGIFQIVVKIF